MCTDCSMGVGIRKEIHPYEESEESVIRESGDDQRW